MRLLRQYETVAFSRLMTYRDQFEIMIHSTEKHTCVWIQKNSHDVAEFHEPEFIDAVKAANKFLINNKITHDSTGTL